MSDPVTTNLPMGLGPQKTGVPMVASAQTALTSALQGGQNTADFFQNQNVANNFSAWLSTTAGQNAWIQSTDESTGNPAWFAAQESGGNMQYLTVNSTIDNQSIQSGTPSGSFPWQGQNYNIVGTLTMTMSYNTTPQWYFQAPLAVAETYPFLKLGGIVWSDLLKPLLSRAATGVKSCFAARASATSEVEMVDLGNNAANQVAGQGIQAGEDLTIDLVAGAAAFGGLVVLAGLPILLDALSHQTTHVVQVYNLTGYNLTWKLACIPHGTMSLAPTTSSTSQQTDNLIPAMTSYAPPGIAPVDCAQNATFGFASLSGYTGIAYVLTFTATDPNTGDTVDTINVMFDVPYTGDNSVSICSGVLSDPESWYGQQAGANQSTSQSTSGSAVKATATYDFLSGEHPGPGGQNQYIYNSLLVFQPVSS
jgi:hypothetical protein